MINKIFISLLFFFALTVTSFSVQAQCSVCTRTSQQLGDEPARNLNAGILYLAAAPLAICGFLGYRWWKKNGD